MISRKHKLLRRVVYALLSISGTQVHAASWTSWGIVESIQVRNNGDFIIRFDGSPGNPMSCPNADYFIVVGSLATTAAGKSIVSSVQLGLATGKKVRAYCGACAGPSDNWNSVSFLEVGEY